jgi:thiol-disulfide isomerase/thioredoxin
MKGIIKSTVCVLFLFGLGACARRAEQVQGKNGWTLDNNQHIALSNYKGKVVVLDFYATWCEPCRDETPQLVQLQNQFGEKGLQIVGLNVGGEDDRAEVPAYAKEFSIKYQLGYPDDDLVTEYLSDDQSIPQSFVFDRNGKLVKRLVGYTESSGTELEEVIKTTIESAAR